jgi:predicted CoA-binding protein
VAADSFMLPVYSKGRIAVDYCSTPVELIKNQALHSDIGTSMNQQADNTTDTFIRDILRDTSTIAMIGASAEPGRASNSVMRYLQDVGYRVIPVNPGLAGEKLLGERAYDSLREIPERFDLVDVFRRVDAVPGIVDELLPLIGPKGVRYLWMQLDIVDDIAAERAREAGLAVVMDRCLKIEHVRLFGQATAK